MTKNHFPLKLEKNTKIYFCGTSAEVTNLSKRKSEIHSLLGGSSFMNEEKSYLVINGFFSPHVDHFQLM